MQLPSLCGWIIIQTMHKVSHQSQCSWTHIWGRSAPHVTLGLKRQHFAEMWVSYSSHIYVARVCKRKLHILELALWRISKYDLASVCVIMEFMWFDLWLLVWFDRSCIMCFDLIWSDLIVVWYCYTWCSGCVFNRLWSMIDLLFKLWRWHACYMTWCGVVLCGFDFVCYYSIFVI